MPKLDTAGAEFRNGNWIVDVTNAARSIFGDIVVTAHQIVSDNAKFTSWSEHYTREIVKNKDGEIRLTYGDVILIFTNGNRVSIHSSEWGAIEKAGE